MIESPPEVYFGRDVTKRNFNLQILQNLNVGKPFFQLFQSLSVVLHRDFTM